LETIIDTLSTLLTAPVVIENDHFDLLGWSFRGCTGISDEELAKLQVSIQKYWQYSTQNSFRQILQESHRTVHLVRKEEEIATPTRSVAPIIAGKKTLGYISALELNRPLSEQSHAAIEQAAIILALEFMKHEAERANLLPHIINAQEEERKRIARELHDETSQTITALIVGLDTAALALKKKPNEAIRHLESTKEIAQGMLENIHRIISDLRPAVLDDFGLISALTWYGEQRLKPLGIQLRLGGNALNMRLAPPVETVLFRIIQEAVTNVIRHAQASQIRLSIDEKEGHLKLEIADNGKGFDPDVLKTSDTKQDSLGLRGMKERVSTLNGMLDIQTETGRGTKITILIPITKGVVIYA
jgi:signal transduction histidine kinase